MIGRNGCERVHGYNAILEIVTTQKVRIANSYMSDFGYSKPTCGESSSLTLSHYSWQDSAVDTEIGCSDKSIALAIYSYKFAETVDFITVLLKSIAPVSSMHPDELKSTLRDELRNCAYSLHLLKLATESCKKVLDEGCDEHKAGEQDLRWLKDPLPDDPRVLTDLMGLTDFLGLRRLRYSCRMQALGLVEAPKPDSKSVSVLTQEQTD